MSKKVSSISIKKEDCCNNTCEEMIFDDPLKEEECNKKIWGWENAEEVANYLWSSIHSNLLNGDLVFAYKNIDGSSELRQIVVVQNNNMSSNDFSVGMFTNGYSALIPHVTLNYLTTEVINDLKKYKVDKKIIDSISSLIETRSKLINN